MAVYGYIRVSTPNQNTARQEDALKDHADRVFMDKASGASMENRTEFHNLLALLREGDTLLVLSLDRAFRSLRDALDTIEHLKDRKAHFRALDTGLDTASPYGELFFNISASFAQFERKIAAQRRDEGIEAAKKRGVRFGRPPALTATQVHHAMVQINSEGKSVTEMAEVLGVDRSTLHRAIKRVDDIRAIPHDVRKLGGHIITWCIMRDIDLFDTAANIHKGLEGIPPMEDMKIDTFKAGLEAARNMQRQHDNKDESA